MSADQHNRLPAASRAATKVGASLGRSAIIGVLAAAAALYFFCPKFVLWRGINLPNLPGIGIPDGAKTAEVRRAHASLAQLRDPGAAVDDPVSRPIAWRLLFPFVWHYLNLPAWLFLLMPFVGCGLTLGLVAHVVIERTGSQAWGLLTATAVAACPWFFVSTGWLAYFDSWMILGLLVAAFVPSRVALATACLLVPWIDERLLLGLTLCLIVRFYDRAQIGRWSWKEAGVETAIAFFSGAAYVGLRLALANRGTGELNAYADEHFNWARLMNYSPARCAEGIWMALRAGWFFVVILLCSYWKAARWATAATLLVALIMTIGTALVIASDLGRTLGVLVPLMVAGILVAARGQPNLVRVSLPAVTAANLLLPAAHVFTTEREPIFYLYAELERSAHPPPDVNPETYVGWGRWYADQKRLLQADACFQAALALDGRFCEAFVQRGILHLNAGDLAGAAGVLTEAVQACPNAPDTYFLRGLLRLRSNDRLGGASDLQRALQDAAADWPHKQEASDILRELQTAPVHE